MVFRIACSAMMVGFAAAQACTQDEAQALLADPWAEGNAADACGHPPAADIIHHKIKHDKFNPCFAARMGVSEQCADCYADAADYGIQNCVTPCMTKWCHEGCLKCTEPSRAALEQCTGFTPYDVESCTPTPTPPPSPPTPPSPPSPPSPDPVYPTYYYQTITPASDTNLCVDLPGGDTSNGNQLWLWECNGLESQAWRFDNWQIRYAPDESKCIDAGDLADGLQLFLWDCNGYPQQTWGYDSEASSTYLADTSTCLDFYGDWDFSGQPLHVWECSGDWNQEWSIWDQNTLSTV